MVRTISNKYLAVFALVAIAQLLDLATFIPAVARVGIEGESNPIAKGLYLSVGPWGPAALKVVVIAIMFLALIRVARRFPSYALPSGAILAGIGLIGAASNLFFGLLS